MFFKKKTKKRGKRTIVDAVLAEDVTAARQEEGDVGGRLAHADVAVRPVGHLRRLASFFFSDFLLLIVPSTTFLAIVIKITNFAKNPTSSMRNILGQLIRYQSSQHFSDFVQRKQELIMILMKLSR